MQIIDNIAYPTSKNPVLSVVSVKPMENHQLLLRFSTGEKRIFNFTPLLNTGVFTQLKNKEVFDSVYLDLGVPVWNDGLIDIAPETLYQYSNDVE